MEQFEETLETLLSRHLPGFQQLVSTERLTGGASQETWRLSVITKAGEEQICLRRNAGAVDAGDVNSGVEARLMQAALAGGVPVPEIYHVLEPADGLGEGFLMQWLEGETLGGRITHSRQFADIRPALAQQCGDILGRLHGIDLEASQLADSLPAATPEDLVRQTWQQYRDMDTSQPMLDFTARWLLDHLPPPVDATLVHGDFRNGNLMVTRQEGVVGVLDWELAGIGDPVRDLGWVCTNSWRFGRADLPVGGFGTLPALLESYRAASGRDVSQDHLRFWMVFGSFWWSVCCLIMAQSYRSGENRSVERPAIGRRASEGQADCVSLLIPGPVELAAVSVSPRDELPRQDELLASVGAFLSGEVSRSVPGATGYLARVAANSLAIAQREQRLGPGSDDAESQRLDALVGEGSLMEQRARLVDRLREDMPLDTPGLAVHLRQTVMDRLAIDQPAYRVTPNASVAALWDDWIAGLEDPTDALSRGCRAWHFCDNQADADECAELVMAGRKRATASSLWACELENEAPPAVGDLAIVTDWSGRARCLIRTTDVRTVAYRDVDETFAAEEGEGDGSLAWWREAHWASFTRELVRLGREPNEDMPVICERFEVLRRAPE